jgi:hypothetical protein
MSSTRNPGRFAGSLYLMMSIPGVSAMVYVPSKLIVHGNAAATASRGSRDHLGLAAREDVGRLC